MPRSATNNPPQLPELAHNFKKDSYVLLAVKHLGLLLGVGLMVLILWAEEQLAH